MGLFGRKKDAGQDDDAFRTLSHQVADLQADFKRIRLEWEETYDKVARLLGRIAKRQARELEAEARENPPPPENGMDEISARILARRKKLRGA